MNFLVLLVGIAAGNPFESRESIAQVLADSWYLTALSVDKNRLGRTSESMKLNRRNAASVKTERLAKQIWLILQSGIGSDRFRARIKEEIRDLAKLNAEWMSNTDDLPDLTGAMDALMLEMNGFKSKFDSNAHFEEVLVEALYETNLRKLVDKKQREFHRH